MSRCTCGNHPPRPGSVRIAVFCAECQSFMGELAGDIDEQLAALTGVAEDIHTVRDIKAMMAAMDAGARTTSCTHEDYEPGSVTYTEIYDGEGFRPFG